MQIITPGETRKRVRRNPSFPLAGTMKPFGLYPVMATPVLPGETLTEFRLRRRILSLPVKHPLIGAWMETWLVFVKLTDIDHALAQMFLTMDADPTDFLAGSSSDRFFTRTGQVDYIKLATQTIWHHYFRDESETTAPTIDGVPMVKRRWYDWAHNLSFTPDTLVVDDLPSNPEGQLTGMDIMSMMGMSEMTYEKYLQQYGVSKKAAEATLNAPEILRYSQAWTTPTNQVDPVTGAPSSAWTWSEDLKADKPKRFDEPGFLIVLSAVRPKMFTDALRYSMVGNLWGFADFFPSYNLSDPAAGIKEILTDDHVFADAFGPNGEDALSLLYDHRDLLTRGEQFVNDWSGPYTLPLVSTQRAPDDTTSIQTLRGMYPSEANINGLFMEDLEGAPVDARRRLYYEGICELQITGHVKDTTL